MRAGITPGIPAGECSLPDPGATANDRVDAGGLLGRIARRPRRRPARWRWRRVPRWQTRAPTETTTSSAGVSSAGVSSAGVLGGGVLGDPEVEHLRHGLGPVHRRHRSRMRHPAQSPPHRGGGTSAAPRSPCPRGPHRATAGPAPAARPPTPAGDLETGSTPPSRRGGSVPAASTRTARDPELAPTRRPVKPSSVKVTAAMLRITESPAGKLDTTRVPTDTTTCPPTSVWRRSAASGMPPSIPCTTTEPITPTGYRVETTFADQHAAETPGQRDDLQRLPEV